MAHNVTVYAHAGEEPALSDLLADPILHTLMKYDRLTERDLLIAIERGRIALRTASARPAVGVAEAPSAEPIAPDLPQWGVQDGEDRRWRASRRA